MNDYSSLLSKFVERLAPTESRIEPRSRPSSETPAFLRPSEREGEWQHEQPGAMLFLAELWKSYDVDDWEFGDLRFVEPQYRDEGFVVFMEVVQFVVAIRADTGCIYCFLEWDASSHFWIAPTLAVYLDALAFMAEQLDKLPDDFDYRREADRIRKDAIYPEVMKLVGVDPDSDAAQFWLNVA
jgi:hypothetical protein